jgi:mRNA-degrading endonuclease RelE of RelBE toxin-antitoxin system
MQFIYTPTAQKHFKRLYPPARKRIVDKMRFFADQPDSLAFAEPLSGSASYRYRIGDYRVIFEVQHGVGWILAIKRRDEAYR